MEGLVNNESEWKWQEAIVAEFKVLSRTLPEGTSQEPELG
jgi:hypothetical protein